MTERQDFEKVYNDYYRAVESYFLKRVPTDDAEDLAQQTFMKFWAFIRSAHSVRSYKSLIFVIAKSVLVDYYRKRSYTIPLDEAAENIALVYSLDIEDVIAMHTTLVSLPPEEKMIIELKAQGFSSGEIGKRLNISSSAVRSRLQAIRKKFK